MVMNEIASLGGIGEVLKATCRQDGKIYALKRMRLRLPKELIKELMLPFPVL